MSEKKNKNNGNKSAARPALRRRGMGLLVTLLVFVLAPAAVYGVYVIRQLDDIRMHDLRGLNEAAVAAERLLDNAATSVRNLINDSRTDACTFFERQVRLRLRAPTGGCDELNGDQSFGRDVAKMELVRSGGRFEIAVDCNIYRPDDASESIKPLCASIEVVLDTVLQQVPFGESFDQLLFADNNGRVVGAPVSPQRASPMLPPGVVEEVAGSPVRVFDIPPPMPAGDDEATGSAALDGATVSRSIEIGGARYTLMCQPWRMSAALTELESGGQVLHLCGLKDRGRSFNEALEIAPNVVIFMAALVTLILLSWPILKVLSMAPRERIRFSDMYMMLLSTLVVTMLLSAAVGDVASYTALRERSSDRLVELAEAIGASLTAELERMYKQLVEYDEALAAWTPESGNETSVNRRAAMNCLLVPTEARRDVFGCEGDEVAPSDSDDAPDDESPDESVLPVAQLLGVPTVYPHFETVFWSRPCDGRQFIKGTTRTRNTPIVPVNARRYYQAIKANRPWNVAESTAFYAETGASITTGEFFMALSKLSDLSNTSSVVSGATVELSSLSDCTEQEYERFAAVMVGRPASMQFPVLAPGVGFAVVDQAGTAVFHSDPRRAGVENLLDDEGISVRLRAALNARADVGFNGTYQTRPHQIYVDSLENLPWSVVTFVDKELLRTYHIEIMVRAAVLITAYFLVALLGTLAYIALNGRRPPAWIWPRRGSAYKEIYGRMLYCLAAQLAIMLVVLDFIQGPILALFCVLSPAIALFTIAIASYCADLLDRHNRAAAREKQAEAAGKKAPSDDLRLYSPAQIGQIQRRWCAVGVAVVVVFAIGAFIGMRTLDPVAWSIVEPGIGILLAILVAAATLVVGLCPWQKLPAMFTQQLRHPLAAHVTASTMFWLILGALPAYGFLEIALTSEAALVGKVEQAYLARAQAWRGCSIEDYYREVATDDPNLVGRRMAGVDEEGAAEDFRDSYPKALLSKPPETGWDEDVIDTLPVESSHGGLIGFWFDLARRAPIYNETTSYTRFLGPDTGGRFGTWSWTLLENANPVLGLSIQSAEACDAHVDPTVFVRPPIDEPQFGLTRVIGGVALLSLLIAWVIYATRKLFFGDVEDVTRDDNDPRLATRTLAGHFSNLGLPPGKQWLAAELARIVATRSDLDGIDQEALLALPTRRAAVERILELRRGHYESLWHDCDPEARLLLTQLVEEGFANPKQSQAMQRLIREGLVERDPVLRPMNHSFALFVESEAEPEKIKEQENVEQGMTWGRVRGALIVVLVLGLIFLSITQRDSVEIWLAYLGTAAAGSAGVLKLFGMMSRSAVHKTE